MVDIVRGSGERFIGIMISDGVWGSLWDLTILAEGREGCPGMFYGRAEAFGKVKGPSMVHSD